MSESLPTRPLTDADRQLCLDALRGHCVEGRLTLSEFSDRAELVLAASSQTELGVLVGDLSVAEPPPPTRRRAAWAVSIFGSSHNRVRRRISRRTLAMSLFGASWLDLSDAMIDGDEVAVTAVAVFGAVKIVVPSGIEVDMVSLPLFGSSKDASGGRPVTGRPIIRVWSLPVFGAVKVVDTAWLSDLD